MAHRSLAAGFTLLELLVVLAISGMIFSLAGPVYSVAVPGVRLKAEARDLVGALRDTANAAVSSSRERVVKFFPESSSYAIRDARPIELSSSTQLLVEASFDANAHELDDESHTRGTVVLRFFPDGSSSGATIILRNADRGYRIGVDWLTGRVVVLEDVGEA